MNKDTSKINTQIHSHGPDVKESLTHYVVVLHVACNESTNLRQALDLASDRMTEYSKDINVTDIDIDYVI